MAEKSKAGAALKRIRVETGLSVREMAKRLEMPQGSSYSYYENDYKKECLPVELAKKLIPIFRPFSIPPSRVLALAGIETQTISETLSQNGLVKDTNGGNHFPAIRSRGQHTTEIIEVDVTAFAGAGFAVDREDAKGIWGFPDYWIQAEIGASAQDLLDGEIGRAHV